MTEKRNTTDLNFQNMINTITSNLSNNNKQKRNTYSGGLESYMISAGGLNKKITPEVNAEEYQDDGEYTEEYDLYKYKSESNLEELETHNGREYDTPIKQSQRLSYYDSTDHNTEKRGNQELLEKNGSSGGVKAKKIDNYVKRFSSQETPNKAPVKRNTDYGTYTLKENFLAQPFAPAQERNPPREEFRTNGDESEQHVESSENEEGDIPEISNSEMTDKELKRRSMNSRKSENIEQGNSAALAGRATENIARGSTRKPSPDTQMRRSFAGPDRAYSMKPDDSNAQESNNRQMKRAQSLSVPKGRLGAQSNNLRIPDTYKKSGDDHRRRSKSLDCRDDYLVKPKYYSNLKTSSTVKLSIRIPDETNSSKAPQEPKIKKESDIKEDESLQVLSDYNDMGSGNDDILQNRADIDNNNDDDEQEKGKIKKLENSVRNSMVEIINEPKSNQRLSVINEEADEDHDSRTRTLTKNRIADIETMNAGHSQNQKPSRFSMNSELNVVDRDLFKDSAQSRIQHDQPQKSQIAGTQKGGRFSMNTELNQVDRDLFRDNNDIVNKDTRNQKPSGSRSQSSKVKGERFSMNAEMNEFDRNIFLETDQYNPRSQAETEKRQSTTATLTRQPKGANTNKPGRFSMNAELNEFDRNLFQESLENESRSHKAEEVKRNSAAAFKPTGSNLNKPGRFSMNAELNEFDRNLFHESNDYESYRKPETEKRISAVAQKPASVNINKPGRFSMNVELNEVDRHLFHDSYENENPGKRDNERKPAAAGNPNKAGRVSMNAELNTVDRCLFQEVYDDEGIDKRQSAAPTFNSSNTQKSKPGRYSMNAELNQIDRDLFKETYEPAGAKTRDSPLRNNAQKVARYSMNVANVIDRDLFRESDEADARRKTLLATGNKNENEMTSGREEFLSDELNQANNKMGNSIKTKRVGHHKRGTSMGFADDFDNRGEASYKKRYSQSPAKKIENDGKNSPPSVKVLKESLDRKSSTKRASIDKKDPDRPRSKTPLEKRQSLQEQRVSSPPVQKAGRFSYMDRARSPQQLGTGNQAGLVRSGPEYDSSRVADMVSSDAGGINESMNNSQKMKKQIDINKRYTEIDGSARGSLNISQGSRGRELQNTMSDANDSAHQEEISNTFQNKTTKRGHQSLSNNISNPLFRETENKRKSQGGTNNRQIMEDNFDEAYESPQNISREDSQPRNSGQNSEQEEVEEIANQNNKKKKILSNDKRYSVQPAKAAKAQDGKRNTMAEGDYQSPKQIKQVPKRGSEIVSENSKKRASTTVNQVQSPQQRQSITQNKRESCREEMLEEQTKPQIINKNTSAPQRNYDAKRFSSPDLGKVQGISGAQNVRKSMSPEISYEFNQGGSKRSSQYVSPRELENQREEYPIDGDNEQAEFERIEAIVNTKPVKNQEMMKPASNKRQSMPTNNQNNSKNEKSQRMSLNPKLLTSTNEVVSKKSPKFEDQSSGYSGGESQIINSNSKVKSKKPISDKRYSVQDQNRQQSNKNANSRQSCIAKQNYKIPEIKEEDERYAHKESFEQSDEEEKYFGHDREEEPVYGACMEEEDTYGKKYDRPKNISAKKYSLKEPPTSNTLIAAAKKRGSNAVSARSELAPLMHSISVQVPTPKYSKSKESPTQSQQLAPQNKQESAAKKKNFDKPDARYSVSEKPNNIGGKGGCDKRASYSPEMSLKSSGLKASTAGSISDKNYYVPPVTNNEDRFEEQEPQLKAPRSSLVTTKRDSAFQKNSETNLNSPPNHYCNPHVEKRSSCASSHNSNKGGESSSCNCACLCPCQKEAEKLKMRSSQSLPLDEKLLEEQLSDKQNGGMGSSAINQRGSVSQSNKALLPENSYINNTSAIKKSFDKRQTLIEKPISYQGQTEQLKRGSCQTTFNQSSPNSFQLNKAVPFDEAKKTDKRKSVESVYSPQNTLNQAEQRYSIITAASIPVEEENNEDPKRKSLGTKKYSVMDNGPKAIQAQSRNSSYIPSGVYNIPPEEEQSQHTEDPKRKTLGTKKYSVMDNGPKAVQAQSRNSSYIPSGVYNMPAEEEQSQHIEDPKRKTLGTKKYSVMDNGPKAIQGQTRNSSYIPSGVYNMPAEEEQSQHIEDPKRKTLGTKKYSVMDNGPKAIQAQSRNSSYIPSGVYNQSGQLNNNNKNNSSYNSFQAPEDEDPYRDTREKLERLYREPQAIEETSLSPEPGAYSTNIEEETSAEPNIRNQASKKNLSPNKRYSQNVEIHPRRSTQAAQPVSQPKKRTLSQSFTGGTKPSLSQEDFEQLKKEAEIAKNIKREESERERKRKSNAGQPQQQQVQPQHALQQQQQYAQPQVKNQGNSGGKRQSAFVFPVSGSGVKSENRRATETNPSKIRGSIKKGTEEKRERSSSRTERQNESEAIQEEKPVVNKKPAHHHVRSKSVYEERDTLRRTSSSNLKKEANMPLNVEGEGLNETEKEYADITKRLKQNADKLAVKSFLCVKNIPKPHPAILKVCHSLVNLLYGTIECLDRKVDSDDEIDVNNWKKIQSLFASPLSILNSIVNFKGLVEDDIIKQTNINSALKRIESYSKLVNQEVMEMATYRDFISHVHDFIKNAEKMYTLHQKRRKQNSSSEKRNSMKRSPYNRTIETEGNEVDEKASRYVSMFASPPRGSHRRTMSVSEYNKGEGDSGSVERDNSRLDQSSNDRRALGGSKVREYIENPDDHGLRPYPHTFYHRNLFEDSIDKAKRESNNLKGEESKMRWEEIREMKNKRREEENKSIEEELSRSREEAEWQRIQDDRKKYEKKQMMENRQKEMLYKREFEREQETEEKARMMKEAQFQNELELLWKQEKTQKERKVVEDSVNLMKNLKKN